MTDSQREDVPRISVDTLHDWERIKKSYSDAAMTELEERMAKEGRFKKDEDKEALRAYLRKVSLVYLARKDETYWDVNGPYKTLL